MKVFKRGIAACLAAMLLIPGRPVMASNKTPQEYADGTAARERNVEPEREAAASPADALRKTDSDREQKPDKYLTGTAGNAVRETEDTVGFNTGSCMFHIVSREDFDSGLGDDFFQEDGSYTIHIPEENPFFPYEVQFEYDGRKTNQWFMTPEDTVTVGGHPFYVSAYFDGSAITQMDLQVAGDTVAVYPEKKVFTDGDGAAAASLLPLEERRLTVDLSDYTPIDLTMVSVDYIFSGGQLGTGDKVIWKYDDYYYDSQDEDYVVSRSGDTINLSRNTFRSGTTCWELIVGEDNQLNADNVRYLIDATIKSSVNWLTPAVYKQDSEGNRTKVTVLSGEYYDYISQNKDMDDCRQLDIAVTADQLEWDMDAFVGLEINKTVFGSHRFSNLKVYSGREISDAADITEQIFAKDMAAKDAGFKMSNNQWITMAAYDSAGKVIGCLPLEICLNPYGNHVSINGVYDAGSQGDNIIDSIRNGYTDGRNDYTITLDYGCPADKEYNLSLSYYTARTESSSSVTAAYVGDYSSIAQAKDAGAVNIKDSLFAKGVSGGYKANYSKGVQFTVFVGDDGLKTQEIYKCFVKTQEMEITLDDSTAISFIGLKDAGGNDIPSYSVKNTNDSYGDYSYRTILVDKTVDLSSLAPVFTTQNGIKLYTKGSTSPEISGVSVHDFSSGPIHYTAGSESKKEQQNYWLQVVKQTDGPGKLYINSLNDKNADTRFGDPITSVREMIIDGRYDYRHDILLINTGTDPIAGLTVELDSAQVELDSYWTLNGTHDLAGFSSIAKQESHGELANMAKVRIKAKEHVESGDISGKLIIKSGNKELMVLTLSGTIGDPGITTAEIPDAVKYVPYGTMIQNNNKYSWNSVSYSLAGGTLPGGMRLYPNGELYGVPLESGEFTFTVRMRNSFSKFRSSEKTFTLTVKDNTNLNVYNASDSGYTLAEHVGTEVGAGSRDYLLNRISDQLFVSTGQYGEFIDFWLNGEKLVEGEDYTKESGSTRITIRRQTFEKKAKRGTNTLAAEFRVQGDRSKELKRTAQNFRLEAAPSGGSTSNGSGGGSTGGSRSSGGSGSSSAITYNSKKGYVHAQTGIITGTGTGYSRWIQDEQGWKFLYADGTFACGHMAELEDKSTVDQILWEKINGSWYAFGADGYLKSGWVYDYQLKGWYNLSVDNGMQSGWYTDLQDRNTYYLEPQAGKMAVGWKAIDNKWYYFNARALTQTWELNADTGNWYYNTRSKSKPFGSMYKAENTPDGYYVDGNGVWDGKEHN